MIHVLHTYCHHQLCCTHLAETSNQSYMPHKVDMASIACHLVPLYSGASSRCALHKLCHSQGLTCLHQFRIMLCAAGTKPDVLLFALCGFDLGQSVQMAKEAAQKLAAAGSKSIPALAHSRVAAVDGT